MTTIGFIGVGRMGGPMAGNLVKAGHHVTAYDPSEAARAAAAEAGAETADAIGAAVAHADAVVTMLPAGPQARAVYGDPGGVLDSAPTNALLIDCSTIDVETARFLSSHATSRGFRMVDAPVSGGTAAAQAGALTFMVGGAAADAEAARPILSAMGKRVVHCGGAGNGQAAKICNNMLLGVSMIGTCEAFALAEKLGLDPETFFDVAAHASGQCWSLTSYCPMPGPVPAAPSNRGYAPGFSAAMMLKDLRLAQQAAASCGAATPLGAAAGALYALMEASDEGSMDFSAVLRLIRGALPTTTGD